MAGKSGVPFVGAVQLSGMSNVNHNPPHSAASGSSSSSETHQNQHQNQQPTSLAVPHGVGRARAASFDSISSLVNQESDAPLSTLGLVTHLNGALIREGKKTPYIVYQISVTYGMVFCFFFLIISSSSSSYSVEIIKLNPMSGSGGRGGGINSPHHLNKQQHNRAAVCSLSVLLLFWLLFLLLVPAPTVVL